MIFIASVFLVSILVSQAPTEFKVFGRPVCDPSTVQTINAPSLPVRTKTKKYRASSTTSARTQTSVPTSTPPASATWECPDSATSLSDWNAKMSYGAQNLKFISDADYSGGVVMQVSYPKGSYIPSRGKVGGLGFYAQPIDISQAQSVTLSYDVKFPAGFKFVKGGKLPGLYGGHKGCSGGKTASDCFSSRYMWRTNGAGEIYAYVSNPAQDPGFCSAFPPLTVCNPSYGNSLARGSFFFNPGKWTSLVQTITLNTAGKRDGSLIVHADGKEIINYDKMVWRTSASVGFVGIDFETFFGGHDSSWASPADQTSLFQSFKLTVNK